MKIFIITFLVILSQACAAQKTDEASIRDLLSHQTESWNHGDIERFMNTYWKSDSLMFIGKSGVTYGWTNTLNNYKKNYPDKTAMGKLAFEIITIKPLSPKYFQVVGKWFLKRTIGDLSGHYTLLLEKIDGKWVIISDHSS